MAIAVILMGVVFGMLGFGTSLILGQGLLAALLMYMIAGLVAVGTTLVLVMLRTETTPESEFPGETADLAAAAR